MGIQYRKRIHIPLTPIYINISGSGISLSVKEGPASWNSRRGFSLNLPGGLSWRQSRRRKS